MKTNKAHYVKAILSTLCTFVTLIGSHTLAGGADGGGGGGICFNGHCQTLAQAGLVIKKAGDEVQYYLPNEQLRKELHRILFSAPHVKVATQELYEQIIGKGNTYILVQAADERKFKSTIKKYQKEYKKLIEDSASGVESDNLKILAFSDSENKKTYLLPDFFNLDIRGQALLLIHEDRIRAGQDLMNVLTLDVELLKWLDNRSLYREGALNLIEAMMAANLYANKHYSNFMVEQLHPQLLLSILPLLASRAKPFTFNELCGDEAVETLRANTLPNQNSNKPYILANNNFSCTPGQERALQLAGDNRSLFQLLSNLKINLSYVLTGMRLFIRTNKNMSEVAYIFPESWSSVAAECARYPAPNKNIILGNVDYYSDALILYDCATKLSYIFDDGGYLKSPLSFTN